jgi:DNA-3-methyladenine glycosylase II
MEKTFTLRAKSHFRLDLTVWALRRRESNIIDNWDGQYYQRVMIILGKPILVGVFQKNIKSPSLMVTTHRKVSALEVKEIKINLKIILGLSYNAKDFYQLAAKNKYLKDLVKKLMGLKPPHFLTLFESLCNAIGCQQLSLNVGIELLNRLARHYGKKVKHNKKIYYAFPTPLNISKCKPKDLQKLGFSLRKSKVLIQIANILKTQEPVLQKKFTKISDNNILICLQSIKGIGRWSAEYVLLRGLGRLHIFPGDDVGAQRNLQNFLHLRGKMDYGKVAKIVKPWFPYAGLIYFHLLLNNINQQKCIA